MKEVGTVSKPTSSDITLSSISGKRSVTMGVAACSGALVDESV